MLMPMATRPPEPTPQLHHGRMKWTSRYVGRDGIQKAKRFGPVLDMSKRAATLAYSEWMQTWERRDKNEVQCGGRYTVREMAEACRKWADSRFRKGDGHTSSYVNYDLALRRLVEVYGDKPADEVRGPQIVRLRDEIFSLRWDENGDRMLDESGNQIVQACRTVNYGMIVIRQAYTLAREAGKISAETLYDVLNVKRANFRDGLTKKPRKILPVAETAVAATIAKCSESLSDMIRFQLLTGARPGEVCMIRPCDIECATPDVWFYVPPEHKTQYADKERLIVIPPAAVAIIGKYMSNRLTTARCFSPREHAAQTPKLAKRIKVTDEWTTCTYRDAIFWACNRAGVDEWTPNQLRHRWATNVRRLLGIEAVKEGLSHESEATSEIYAEQSRERLIDMARRLG